jgi:small subunit ribosomal protein S11
MFSNFKLFKDLKKKREYILKNFIIILVNIQFNNTFVTATDLYGNVLVKACAGILGIKGPKRSTPVATEEITNFVCQFIKKNNFKFVLVKLNGILHTRKMKSAVKAISVYKFIILRALNITPKAHNGIKLKKRKRL